MKQIMRVLVTTIILSFSFSAFSEITVSKISGDLSKDPYNSSLWNGVQDQVVSLMAQPMTPPRPKVAETAMVKVSAIHDGKWIAFRIKWADTEPSEGGKIGAFSDAVALQFPVKSNEVPPPVMMGGKDNPVHIFHWRYMYQLDAEQGQKSIEQIYPNMAPDMYPMDFKAKGNYKEATQEQKDSFIGGKAAGNPQSFAKSGVDEIFAEGFGSSAVIENPESVGKGVWKDNEWTVVIARPLVHQGGSVLQAGGKSFISFAAWQGGKDEVGARKAVTMMWTPFVIVK